MNRETWSNCIAMFLAQAKDLGDKPLTWEKRSGNWRSLSWNAVRDQVARLAESLRSQGLQPGDRVILLSENRPEWLIADLAIMAAGGICVPAYTTNTERDNEHIVENSGAVGAIISSQALAQRFLPSAHRSGPLRFIIALEDPGVQQSLNVDILDWSTLLAEAKPEPGMLERAAEELSREHCACIIYTSGTGGAPKGVMIHHGAILHNCDGAKEVVEEIGMGNDRFLSFLPLSHAYEHSGGQFLPLIIGAEIYYAESLEKLGANLLEARPTIMTVVPRLFEMLRNRITRAVQKEGGLKLRMFHLARTIGAKKFQDAASLSLGERLLDPLLERTVRAKVRAQFGGEIKVLISGGAPLNPEVGLFFAGLGLTILQGYGQTEAAPVVSVNRIRGTRFDSVGPPLKNTEVRIASDGEILVRGELVTHGYWRDEKATAEILRDGWLYTGDIGHIEDDGHIVITDRKKDIIVFDKGDNVSPQRVEGMLTLEPEIAQAMAYGEGHPHLVAILVPDPIWLADWVAANGKSAVLADLVDDGDLLKELGTAVDRVNKTASNPERVRRFTIASAPFSVENRQMTPTMKVRRHIIIERYRDALENLY